MIAFNIICVAVSVLAYLWLYLTDVKNSVYQNIMILIMLFSNIGYLCLSISQNLSEAILACKIHYIGGCFMPMLYFFTFCEVARIELKKKVTFPLLLVQIAFYGVICTIGYSDLYYVNPQLVIEDGVGYLVKEYGPLHFLYPLTMGLYFIASISMAIISVLKKKTVNRKEVLDMIMCAAFAVLCYIIQRIAHWGFDIMPVSYMILMLGAIVPIYHSNLFTVEENKNIVQEQLNKVGFVNFNRKMEYMGCNKYATGIFPELVNCEVGKPITECGDELGEILDGIREFDSHLSDSNTAQHSHSKFRTFKIGERCFETEIHTINDFRNKCVGYTIEFRDETEHHRIVELTSQYNETLTKEVNEKTERISDIQQKTILGMAQMVESRDMSTGGHIKRTSDVVKIFADKLLTSGAGFSEDFLNMVIRSAPMHDLGKIGVDDAILCKKGKFTDEEYEQMKKHAEIGGKMVKDILTGVEEEEFVRVAENVAHYHHEKINGKGYPMGLSGEQIPIEARIMALADVFDALVSKRCYKEAFTYDKAFSIIREDSGSHFDPILAPIFCTCRPELEAYYDNCEK